jgi:hypothetical protein
VAPGSGESSNSSSRRSRSIPGTRWPRPPLPRPIPCSRPSGWCAAPSPGRTRLPRRHEPSSCLRHGGGTRRPRLCGPGVRRRFGAGEARVRAGAGAQPPRRAGALLVRAVVLAVGRRRARTGPGSRPPRARGRSALGLRDDDRDGMPRYRGPFSTNRSKWAGWRWNAIRIPVPRGGSWARCSRSQTDRRGHRAAGDRSRRIGEHAGARDSCVCLSTRRAHGRSGGRGPERARPPHIPLCATRVPRAQRLCRRTPGRCDRLRPAAWTIANHPCCCTPAATCCGGRCTPTRASRQFFARWTRQPKACNKYTSTRRREEPWNSARVRSGPSRNSSTVR